MAYNLSIKENPSYLHFIVNGKNTKQNVIHYLQDILKASITRKHRKILIEEHLTGPRLTEFPVFEIASEGSENARGYFDAIAYVDTNARGNLMKFAETVAVNRGLPVNVFYSVADAEKWLNKLAIEVKDEIPKQQAIKITEADSS